MSDSPDNVTVPSWLKNPLLALVVAMASFAWQAADEARGGRTSPNTQEKLQAMDGKVKLLAQAMSTHITQLDHPHGVETRASHARAELSKRLAVAEVGLVGIERQLENLVNTIDRLSMQLNSLEQVLLQKVKVE